jgi:hypothetical protein
MKQTRICSWLIDSILVDLDSRQAISYFYSIIIVVTVYYGYLLNYILFSGWQTSSSASQTFDKATLKFSWVVAKRDPTA